MAQLVEHILGKDEVPSSNLGSSSRKPPIVRSGALVFLGGLNNLDVTEKEQIYCLITLYFLMLFNGILTNSFFILFFYRRFLPPTYCIRLSVRERRFPF